MQNGLHEPLISGDVENGGGIDCDSSLSWADLHREGDRALAAGNPERAKELFAKATRVSRRSVISPTSSLKTQGGQSPTSTLRPAGVSPNSTWRPPSGPIYSSSNSSPSHSQHLNQQTSVSAASFMRGAASSGQSFSTPPTPNTPLVSRRCPTSWENPASPDTVSQDTVVVPPLHLPTSSEPRRLVGGRRASLSGSSSDIVQFTAPIYFVEEEEGYIQIDVMRLGSMEGPCSVQYKTVDASAVNGKRYEAASGTITFQSGEHTKQIKIVVIEDDVWSTTLEFKVVLDEPICCELGLYLHQCRVKIIDNDTFPSSKHRRQILEGKEGIEEIPNMTLLWEYFKLNLKSEGMMSRTLITIVFCQLPNVYLFLTLYINIYLIDVLFNFEEGAEERLIVSDRRKTAMIVGILYLIPMLIVHYWDFRRIKLDVCGRSREFLQINMFRKYLNYNQQSRDTVASAEMQVAIVDETKEVVEGYMAALELVQGIGKLFILSYFILLENPRALTPVVLMPSSMVLFIYYRTKIFTETAEKASERTAQVFTIVHEVCQKYPLIAEYMQRPRMCEIFQNAAQELTKAEVPAQLVKMNNSYFPKWLGPIFIGVYIAVGAGEVFDGTVSLGQFLATVRIFGELSEQFTEAYTQVITLVAATGPLKKLTWLFNLPTDLKDWKKVNRQRRMQTANAREEILKAMSHTKVGVDEEHCKTDMIQIKVTSMSFHYEPGLPVLQNVSISSEQGKLVAVVGEHGSGKATFLRLLGHMFFPNEGSILVPTHLRILHVSQSPILLNLSVWHNLTFGFSQCKPERLDEIIEELRMPKTAELLRREREAQAKEKETQLFRKPSQGKAVSGRSTSKTSKSKADDDSDGLEEDAPSDACKWIDTLNSGEKAKIHLARALIVNPEVLVLQRPFIHYDEEEGDRIARVIHQHVKNRGIKLDPDKKSRRRPRTCFYTPSTENELKKADVVWKVESGGVRPIALECQSHRTLERLMA